MITSELKKEISTVNSEAIEAVYKPSKDACPPKADMPFLYYQVGFSNPEITQAVMGLCGAGLYSFFKNIDVTHPEAAHIVATLEQSWIDSHSDPVPNLFQLFAIAEYAIENKLDQGLRAIKLPAPNDSEPLRLLAEKRFYSRILTESAIKKTRAEDEVSPLSIDTFITNCSDYILSQPLSLKGYMRFNDNGKDEIDRLMNQVEYCKTAGLTEISGAFKKRVEKISSMSKEAIFGFQRIKLSFLGGVLARLHNCEIVKDIVSWCVPSSDMFGAARKVAFNSSEGPRRMRYSPQLYPLSQCPKSLLTSTLTKIVAHLDHFPELEGKPLFDRYYLVVPSLKHGAEELSQATRLAIDEAIINAGCVIPALVGERDGKCYFISYIIPESVSNKDMKVTELDQETMALNRLSREKPKRKNKYTAYPPSYQEEYA